MALKLLFTQLSLLYFLFASSIDNICPFEINLIAVSYEWIFSLPPLFLTLSPPIVRIICQIIFVLHLYDWVDHSTCIFLNSRCLLILESGEWRLDFMIGLSRVQGKLIGLISDSFIISTVRESGGNIVSMVRSCHHYGNLWRSLLFD